MSQANDTLELRVASERGETSALAAAQLTGPGAQTGKTLPQSGMPLPSALQTEQVTSLNEIERSAEPASLVTRSATPGRDLLFGDLSIALMDAGSLSQEPANGESVQETRSRSHSRSLDEPQNGQLSTESRGARNELTGERFELGVIDPVPTIATQSGAEPSELHRVGPAFSGAGYAGPTEGSESNGDNATRAKPNPIAAISEQIPVTSPDHHQSKLMDQYQAASLAEPKDVQARAGLLEQSLPAGDTSYTVAGNQRARSDVPSAPAANGKENNKLTTGIERLSAVAAGTEQGALQNDLGSSGELGLRSAPKVQSEGDSKPIIAKTATEADAIKPDGSLQSKPGMVDAPDARANPVAVQVAPAAVLAGTTARTDVTLARTSPRSDAQAPAAQPESRDIPLALAPKIKSQPVTSLPSDVEVAPDKTRPPPSPGLTLPSGAIIAGSQSAPTPVDANALQQSAPQPTLVASAAAPQPTSVAPIADTNSAFRLTHQLESTIEQLNQTRSDAQASRPELTVRHHEFGSVTMRLDAGGGDLRATLSARDPGFIAAIQSALAERGVAATSESSSSGAQRGSDQGGSQSNSQSGSFASSHSGAQGHGWNSGAQYGSSTGSGQGTSQPYPGQTESRDEETDPRQAQQRWGHSGSSGDGERFA